MMEDISMSEDLIKEHNSNSLEVEKTILGAMLSDEKCIPGVIEILDVKDFFSETNRDIFNAIHSMFITSEKIDPVTVLEKMRIDGCHNEYIANYIKELLMMTPSSVNVNEYAYILKEKSKLRENK